MPGKVGRAKHFSGGGRISASAISVPVLDFTVGAWFNWTTNPSSFYSGIQGGGISWELRVTADGRFAIVFYQAVGPDVTTEATSPLTYNDGNWHYALGILRSGLAELYVDGTLVSQDTTNPVSFVRPSTGVIAGMIASYFVGDIDDVSVYDRALAKSEISDLVLSASAIIHVNFVQPLAFNGTVSVVILWESSDLSSAHDQMAWDRLGGLYDDARDMKNQPPSQLGRSH